jgi:predicted ester cyclase
MGEPREVLDLMTAATFAEDWDALTRIYAAEAVAVTPDQGEIVGRPAIIEYLSELLEAFPDAEFDLLAAHESGNVAIDEGYLVGTHSGPLLLPGGAAAPTGRPVQLRCCHVATVERLEITSHRFYFDQMELLDQLDLLPETAV